MMRGLVYFFKCVAGAGARRRMCPAASGHGPVADDLAIFETHDPPAMFRDVFLVRHQNHRLALVVQRLKQRHDLLARPGVQVAGRLVGHQERRVVDEGAGDGDALLLAAGELIGPVGQPVRQADPDQSLPGALLPAPPARIQQGQLDVLQAPWRGARG